MANPPSREHSVVPASTVRGDEFDICFVDKEGHVSLTNSLRYGNETPAPSTRPSLSSRSPTGAPTGANQNPAITTAAGPSSETCTHGSPHQAGTTPPANNWSQNHTSGGPLPGSNGVPEDSLISDQILEEGESPVAKLPDDSYFTLM
jgi:hypothetical protein